MELVAICDIWEERLGAEGKALNVPTFVEYDEFLGCDLDAVVLANYFHQHVPLAIQALNAGKHVMSEIAACHTLGEGAALARAVEQSGKIRITIVFGGDQKKLDPGWTSGLIRRIKPKLIAAGIEQFPSPSFVEKSEWLSLYRRWRRRHPER